MMRLTNRLAAVIVAALVPVIGIETFNAYVTVRREQERTRELAIQYARQTSWELQRLLVGAESVMKTIASAPSVREGSWQRCQTFVDTLKAELPGLTGLVVADTSGKVQCGIAGGPDLDVADRGYFQRALAGEDFVLDRFTIGRISHRQIMPLAVPVRDAAGHVTAVVVAAIDLAWLSEALRQRGVPPDGSVTVADADGMILARQPFPERFIGTRIPDAYLYLLRLADLGAVDVLSQDGTRRTLGYKPLALEPAGLYVSAGLSVEQSFAGVYAAVTRAVVAMGVAILLAIAGATLIGRRFVTAPVAKLVATATRWRAGDLAARSDLRGSDEFGTLGEVFDQAIEWAQQREARISMLMNEVSHRVKNQMAIMMSIARHSGDGAATIKAYQEAFYSRVMAMSRAHNLIFGAKADSATLADLIGSQLEPFVGAATLQLAGPPVRLDPDAMQYVGMALHELATNASKYGALSIKGGAVGIVWSVERPAPGAEGEPILRIRWTEQDGPTVSAPARKGFGNTVLTKGVGALGGEASLAFEPVGVVWTCEFTGHFTAD